MVHVMVCGGWEQYTWRVAVSLAEIELKQWLILAFTVDIVVLVFSACSTSVSIASSFIVVSSISRLMGL